MRRIINHGIIALALFAAASSCGTDRHDISGAGVETETGERPAEEEVAPSRKGPRDRERVMTRFKGSFAEVFNDSNYRQYALAERYGIKPIESLEDSYFTTRPLVKIESNRYYEVDKLTHSVPYLVPSAARLLEDIGRSFIDSLEHRGGDGYRLVVTSVLRTPQSVRSLRRVNRNATDSSTHKFATTFDISWARFNCLDTTRTHNENDLKCILAEVLYDMRAKGRCLVKYERKSPCFHITVAE